MWQTWPYLEGMNERTRTCHAEQWPTKTSKNQAEILGHSRYPPLWDRRQNGEWEHRVCPGIQDRSGWPPLYCLQFQGGLVDMVGVGHFFCMASMSSSFLFIHLCEESMSILIMRRTSWSSVKSPKTLLQSRNDVGSMRAIQGRGGRVIDKGEVKDGTCILWSHFGFSSKFRFWNI